MGRFSSSNQSSAPIGTSNQPIQSYNTNPFASGGHQHMQSQPQMSQEEMARMQAMQQAQATWPQVFPKQVIGLDRDGVIIKDNGDVISSPEQIQIIPGALEGIRMMRLKGYRVFIISDQPGISKGKLTTDQVDAVNNRLMQVFGEAGIFSIDGLYYSTSEMKDDLYAKPNPGMFDRAKKEHPNVDWKKGWYVGDKLVDLKSADRVGSKPVLVRSDNWDDTLQKLDTFANRDLKAKTKTFDNLLEFAQSLP